MNNSIENILLALYREKVNYLSECHKVYHGILGLLGTGIIISFSFLMKNDTNHTVTQYFIVGIPFLINGWFAAYLFCYWYNNLICWNVDYVEKLICKELLNSKRFPTWYADFFGIVSLKPFAYVLFGIIAFSIAVVYCSSIYLIRKNNIIEEIFGKSNFFTIIKCSYVGYIALAPTIMFFIHIYYIRKRNKKIMQYYADAGLLYRGSR